MLVYALTNVRNSKRYIGQTQHSTLEKRWSVGLKNSPNAHLRASIARYGPQAFRREVLAYTNVQEEADALERYYILLWRTTNPEFGYNLMLGGRQGPGRHIEDVKERISYGSKQMWARRSPKDRWEFQFATKLRWLNRTEEEREKISRNITKALTGKPRTDTVWNKGLKVGGQPKTEEHRRKIGLGIRRHYEQKRRKEVWMTERKPPVGTKVERLPPPPVDRKQPMAVKGLKEIEATRRQLREIQKRLNQLEFEFKGGCLW